MRNDEEDFRDGALRGPRRHARHIREATTTLEGMNNGWRMLGGAHPTTAAIERNLRGDAERAYARGLPARRLAKTWAEERNGASRVGRRQRRWLAEETLLARRLLPRLP